MRSLFCPRDPLYHKTMKAQYRYKYIHQHWLSLCFLNFTYFKQLRMHLSQPYASWGTDNELLRQFETEKLTTDIDFLIAIRYTRAKSIFIQTVQNENDRILWNGIYYLGVWDIAQNVTPKEFLQHKNTSFFCRKNKRFQECLPGIKMNF
jgi:hypothetical protein